MHFVNIKFIFIIVAINCGIWIPDKGLANCLSFLPHGYNGLFVHLPKNEKFCVNTPDGTVQYHTNKNGARIIKGKITNKAIYAFGESQLIEIFPRQNGIKHALQMIYGNQTRYLHGAPNNGPNETLAFIKYVATDLQKELTKVTVGINLGFDLFRIIPGWRTSDKVEFGSSDIPVMMKFPKVFKLIHAGKAFFSNKYEFINAEKQILKARLYFKNSKSNIEKYLPLWLDNLNKLQMSFSLGLDIILFQSYWVYDINLEENRLNLNPIYSRLIKKVICRHLLVNNIADRIYFYDYYQNITPNKKCLISK